MATDRYGQEIKVGDMVTLELLVTEVHEGNEITVEGQDGTMIRHNANAVQKSNSAAVQEAAERGYSRAMKGQG